MKKKKKKKIQIVLESFSHWCVCCSVCFRSNTGTRSWCGVLWLEKPSTTIASMRIRLTKHIFNQYGCYRDLFKKKMCTHCSGLFIQIDIYRLCLSCFSCPWVSCRCARRRCRRWIAPVIQTRIMKQVVEVSSPPTAPWWSSPESRAPRIC